MDRTWVTVHIRFRGAGSWPGKYTFVKSFGSCGVLGFFNAGALRLPHLLPKSQLHREDLEQNRVTQREGYYIYSYIFTIIPLESI